VAQPRVEERTGGSCHEGIGQNVLPSGTGLSVFLFLPRFLHVRVDHEGSGLSRDDGKAQEARVEQRNQNESEQQPYAGMPRFSFLDSQQQLVGNQRQEDQE